MKVLLLLCAFVMFGGCASLDAIVGQIGATDGSYDLKGEKVVVKLLTFPQMVELVANRGIAVQDFPELKAPQSVAAAALAVAGLELAFDIVKEEIKKEGARYEQQFSGQTASDAWYDSANNRLMYHGLLIQRLTDREEPAFETLYIFKPLAGGQFMAVRPVYSVTRRSKAKLIEPSVETEIVIEMQSMWVDEEGVLQNKRTSAIECKETRQLGNVVKGVDLPMVGVLVTPPPLNAESDESIGTIKVTVTERDLTVARKVVEKVGQVVDKQGPVLIKMVEDRLSDNPPADDPMDGNDGGPPPPEPDPS